MLNLQMHDDPTWAELVPKLHQHAVVLFPDQGHPQGGIRVKDRYRMNYRKHETATHIEIYALMPSGRRVPLKEFDELLVYKEDAWCVGNMEHHNRDTIQGYQFPGPWVKELEDYRQMLIVVLEERIALGKRQREQELDRQNREVAGRIERFRAAFAKKGDGSC